MSADAVYQTISLQSFGQLASFACDIWRPSYNESYRNNQGEAYRKCMEPLERNFG